MKGTFDFTVQRRESRYVFVARQYGVVVWADEASSGIRELESRVENVAAQFREAGVEPEQTDVGSIGKHGVRNTMVTAAHYNILGLCGCPATYTRLCTGDFVC